MLRRLWGLALAAALMLPSPAQAGPVLTLRSADRIIDRAFAAELAGDFAGARAAVAERIGAAKLAEEGPGRARLQAWVVGLDRRERAFSRLGRTAGGYWRAFQTLRDFGPGRADLMWHQATRDLVQLEAELERIAQVDLRFERVVGLKKGLRAWEEHLVGLLAKYGIQQDPANKSPRYEVRINLDATEASELMGRWRVTVESSYLLRNLHDEERLVGSFTKRRAVTRSDEESARRFGVRRVMDDLGWTLVYQLREDALRDLAAP